MTTFDDRERAHETKFARDEDMAFRVQSRRNKLAGLWAAERRGLSGVEAEAYAATVVVADFEEAGDEDVVRKLVADTGATPEEIRSLLADKAAEARQQLGGQL